MLVITGETYDDGTKDVLCTSCLGCIGRLDNDEISALAREDLEGVYCFECDSVGADMVHISLLRNVRVFDRTEVFNTGVGAITGYKTVFSWQDRWNIYRTDFQPLV